MLPIFRTISVGGVLLAITILGLALIPPGRSHIQFSAADGPARGALIHQHEHPEWRQFLLLAAVRRAEELDRLRKLSDEPDLPDIPYVALDYVPAEGSLAGSHIDTRVAGLPVADDETTSEDVTGSVNVAPSGTMPIDIGEASSSELPVAPAEDKPPVARAPLIVPASEAQASEPQDSTSPPLTKVSALAVPEQIRPVVVIRKRTVRNRAPKAQAAAVPQMQAPPPFNLIQALFAALAGKPISTAEPAAVKPASASQRAKPKQQAAIRAAAQ